MKILLTGASGLFGLNFLATWQGKHVLVGGVHNDAISLDGVGTGIIDVTDRAAVARWIAAESPDLVVHAAGLTNVDACQARPDEARRLNVDSAEYVAAASAAANAALIHISTDHLFDGKKGRYTESDAPSPVNVYAETKLAAEGVVAAAHPRPFIVRTNFFGWGHRRRVSFSDWIIGTLRQKNFLTTFDDVFFTTVLVNDLAKLLLELATRADPGIYNLASDARLSKHEFAVRVADVFGLNASLIRPQSIYSVTLAAPRPPDMSLDTSKAAAALGRSMPDLTEGLHTLRELGERKYPEELNAALIDGARRPNQKGKAE